MSETLWDGGATIWDGGATHWDVAAEVVVYGSLDGTTRKTPATRPSQISNGTRRNIQTSSR